jgi:ABC-type bacteriocin/lantibiotic exporter with double-glycine peptidase domain
MNELKNRKEVEEDERIAAIKLSLGWIFNSSKKYSMILILIVLLGSILTILQPYLFQIIIDEINGKGDLTLFGKISLGLTAVLIVYLIVRELRNILEEINNAVYQLMTEKLEPYISISMMNKVSS